MTVETTLSVSSNDNDRRYALSRLNLLDVFAPEEQHAYRQHLHAEWALRRSAMYLTERTNVWLVQSARGKLDCKHLLAISSSVELVPGAALLKEFVQLGPIQINDQRSQLQIFLRQCHYCKRSLQHG